MSIEVDTKTGMQIALIISAFFGVLMIIMLVQGHIEKQGEAKSQRNSRQAQKKEDPCNNWNSISFEEQLRCAEKRCIAYDGSVPAANSAILHFRYNNNLSVKGFKVVLTANTLQHPELFDGARTTDHQKGFMTCLQYKITGLQNQNACVYINLQTCNAYEIQIGDKLYPYN